MKNGTPGYSASTIGAFSGSGSQIAPISMLGTMPDLMNFAYIEPWAPSPMMPSRTLSVAVVVTSSVSSDNACA